VSAVRSRLGRSPRDLVLSHPHVEAAGGATGFPAEVLVVASEQCADALRDPAYDVGAETRARASDPERWTEPPRARPQLVLRGVVVLHDPERPVTVMPHAHGHSVGDTLVTLERQQIVHAGGLVVTDRNPYAKDADIGAWLATLNGLARQAPRLLVGTRGRALDVDAVRRQRDALAWLRGQVEFGFTEQVPLDEIPARVLAVPAAREHFDLDASPAFVQLLIEQVLAESVAHRRKRGTLD
jgi:glyoxylase-like metal-dependent hydrolase (beta-lactamase superfamily II)